MATAFPNRTMRITAVTMLDTVDLRRTPMNPAIVIALSVSRVMQATIVSVADQVRAVTCASDTGMNDSKVKKTAVLSTKPTAALPPMARA